MKPFVSIFLLLLLSSLQGTAQGRYIRTGTIPGYVTLKCDLHVHTIFSDGEVWPTVRLDEAEQEGLDAIAITDHIEYIPHGDYIPKDLNGAWKVAKEEAMKRDILLIHGAEITRKMPPGHFNALFISDGAALDKAGFMDAIGAAVEQGAFIQWNHPGWKAQRPAGDAHLDSIHKVLLGKGWIHGVEYYNDLESYRDVFPLCIEHHLALTSNSDIHAPFNPGYYPGTPPHRPMTLVFAKGRTEKDLREALFAGRTIAWFGDTLAGREELLRPFVGSCLELGKAYYKNEKYRWQKITNHSDMPFDLVIVTDPATGAVKRVRLLPAGHVTIRLPVALDERLQCTVTNIRIGYETTLELLLPL